MGDISIGSKTIPIRMGINFARTLSGFFVCLVCLPLFFLQYKMIGSKDYFSIGYITLALQMPALWFLYRLAYANTSSDYHSLSRIIKLIMLSGLLFLLVYWLREK
jgi:4-hydroxybenzoate polyprenyltransferase